MRRAVPLLRLLVAAPAYAQPTLPASVQVDAGRVEGPISPRLYGLFAEFMYEGVKLGLHAELLRDRGFEEQASSIGLPRQWEREPDDRNDDPALRFRWDDTVSCLEQDRTGGESYAAQTVAIAPGGRTGAGTSSR